MKTTLAVVGAGTILWVLIKTAYKIGKEESWHEIEYWKKRVDEYRKEEWL